MVSVLVLLSTVLFCWGLYVVACEVSHCPEGKVIRALSGAAQGTVNRRKVAWEDTLRKVSQKIAPLIPMDEAHEEKMKADLTNRIKSMLSGSVRFVEPGTKIDTGAIGNAEVIWIQPNHLGHSDYYKIIGAARTHKVLVHYFKFSSAEKCATQLAMTEADLS